MAVPQHGSRPAVGIFTRICNFVGCILVTLLLMQILRTSQRALTLDLFLSIFLAELNRLRNERNRQTARYRTKENDASFADEKLINTTSNDDIQAVATLVGYREDPRFFRKALQSYINAKACKFVLICVDGDDEPDQEMVEVFKEVYTTDAALIHLDVPLAECAKEFATAGLDIDPNDRAWYQHLSGDDEAVIRHCCDLARASLATHGINFNGTDAITKLCISQPHMHKKGIMFTAFIFCFVICDILGVEFIWSSDSDSWISSDDALQRTLSTIARAPHMGGASTAMYIHNAEDSVVTRLGDAVYMSELYLARSFSGAVAANDCQSGPGALFRVSALSPILLRWYRQTVFGHWMITNEDRHLTTCLLLEGWKVAFVSDVVTATETPATMRRYLLQQLRWARAIHVESFHRPSLYIMQSPLLFLHALKRELTGILVPTNVVSYLLTGKILFGYFNLADVIERLSLSLVYLLLRSPYRGRLSSWFLMVPGLCAHNIPMPAISMWGFATILNDSWGTTARSAAERARKTTVRYKVSEVFYFIVWITMLGGVTARFMVNVMQLPLAYLVPFMVAGMGAAGTVTTYWAAFGK